MNALPVILKIPFDFDTIQEAINQSQDRDTVLVQSDIYYENINFNKKMMLVTSTFLSSRDTSDISKTIIDGNGRGTVVRFASGEHSSSVLEGFTIQVDIPIA